MTVQRMQFQAMCIQVVGILAHIAASYFFIDVMKYGIVGTGLAGGSTNLIVYKLLLDYTKAKCGPMLSE
jgi:peptidoglycan biosynthesis protein MviN/MurJ (putative lipid II flippase)